MVYKDFMKCILNVKQEGLWALDRSPESLSRGEGVYHKIKIPFNT